MRHDVIKTSVLMQLDDCRGQWVAFTPTEFIDSGDSYDTLARFEGSGVIIMIMPND